MPTTLSAGDIAVIGINADNPDSFSFVTLVDLEAGTEIFFTDNGVLSDGSIRQNEGILRYTTTSAVAAGTAIEISNADTTPSVTIGAVTVEDNGFNLSASGDQVIAYQGTVDSPTFLFAAQTNSTEFQTGSDDSNQSDLPPGLTVGETAVAVGAGPGAESEFDNSTYDESVTSGTRAELLAAIADAANWNGSNARIDPLASGLFSITSGDPVLVINEVDADTPSSDTAEFVELFDGGLGNTSLDGLVIVFYNGSDDQSYEAFDLDGFSTDADGYFVLGNPGVANVDLTFDPGSFGALQNGADAVALFQGDATDFPNDTPITTAGLVDVVVYDTNDGDDAGLLGGFGVSTQFNEGANGANATESNSRVPDGSGIFVAQAPTPGAANDALPAAGVSVFESSGSIDISESGTTDSFTVVLDTQPAADVTITLASDAQSTLSTGSLVFTLTDFDTPQEVIVTAVDDAVVEGPHTSTIGLTAASADPDYDGIAIADVTANIADNDVGLTLISTIQGTPDTQVVDGFGTPGSSPLEGQSVTVEGVVTGAYDGLNGFFLQEEASDEDGDVRSSEGIFVFLGADPTVEEGDLVRVTGAVDEFFGKTQIDNDNGDLFVETISSGNLDLVAVPEVDRSAFGENDDVLALEQFESMLVSFPETLTVAEYFEIGRFGQVVLTEGGRPQQFTQNNMPDADAFAAFQSELSSRTVILDDTDNVQNSPLPDGTVFHPQPDGFSIGTQGEDFFRGGDTVENLTGVLDWSFPGFGDNTWRVRPTETAPAEFTPVNTRPDMPEDVGGDLTVASFNVLNYFATLDAGSNTSGPNDLDPRGANSEDEFTRQTQKIVSALIEIDADVVGLVELENDGDDASLQTLVTELNLAQAGRDYQFVATGFAGTDAIKTGFIYDENTMDLSGDFALLDTPDFLDPNGTGLQRNRPALAQTFTEEATGESFTAIVNHYKSKGPSGLDEDPGISPVDVDMGDGQGFWNDTRADASDALVDWLAGDPTGSGDEDFLILGDLNAYFMEDPIQQALDGADDIRGTDDDFTDLAREFIGEDAYSFLFDGQIGTLDYALANDAMLSQVTGVTEWHINADEVNLFDYNNTLVEGNERSFEAKPSGNELFEPNAFRASDHDPVIIGLDLGPDLNLVEGSGRSEILEGTDSMDLIVSGGGRYDRISGGGEEDIYDLTAIREDAGRNVVRILDIEPGETIRGIDLDPDSPGFEVSSVRARGETLYVSLVDDRDLLVLRGITDLSEIESEPRDELLS